MSRGAFREREAAKPEWRAPRPAGSASARSTSLSAPGWLRIACVPRRSGGPLGTRPLTITSSRRRSGGEPIVIRAHARGTEVRAIAIGDDHHVDASERARRSPGKCPASSVAASFAPTATSAPTTGIPVASSTTVPTTARSARDRRRGDEDRERAPDAAHGSVPAMHHERGERSHGATLMPDARAWITFVIASRNSRCRSAGSVLISSLA